METKDIDKDIFLYVNSKQAYENACTKDNTHGI